MQDDNQTQDTNTQLSDIQTQETPTAEQTIPATDSTPPTRHQGLKMTCRKLLLHRLTKMINVTIMVLAT